LFRLEKIAWRRCFKGNWRGSIVDYLQGMLQGDLSYRSSVLLFMGLDAGDGEIALRNGALTLNWPQTTSMNLYQAVLDCAKRFTQFVKARGLIEQPNWLRPIRDNITVHPLGGCALASSEDAGVVNIAPGQRGQVFGYQGLYVADGALFPAAVGANPSATIAALAEWIAHDITGITPDETLGA
jgi:cholesterol oxidase